MYGQQLLHRLLTQQRLVQPLCCCPKGRLQAGQHSVHRVNKALRLAKALAPIVGAPKLEGCLALLEVFKLFGRVCEWLCLCVCLFCEGCALMWWGILKQGRGKK